MKNFINTGFAIFFICSFFTTDLQAQDCKTSDDLLYAKGTLTDSKNEQLGGHVSDFTPAEKKVALKNLNAIESHAVKDFTIQGGYANTWFHFLELYYFDTWVHKSYKYKMGFYGFSCVDGKRENSNEYTSDFEIVANPSIPYFFSLPPEYESSHSFFDADSTKNSGPRIAVFRYLVFTPDVATAINSGTGYYENDQGNIHNNRKDIYRIWYITHPGKKLFAEVSRREYLNSLLEYYEREKMLLSKRSEKKIAESKKYVAGYEKSGNKEMVKSHLQNIQDAENVLAKSQNRYLSKKERVTVLLTTKAQDWLNQVATINPGIRNTGNSATSAGFDHSGYFTFSDFDVSDRAALVVYKWNPDYFKIQLQSPAEPLFFKVSFRYKANTPFTLNIKDTFVEKFDMEGIKKLVVIK